MSRKKAIFIASFFALAYLAVKLAGYFGPRLDYGSYLLYWRIFLEGHNPWIPDVNAYLAKPLDRPYLGSNYPIFFEALAYLTPGDGMRPKKLFALVWVAVGAWLFREWFRRSDRRAGETAALLAFIFLSPYFWIDLVYYGFFDVLMAAAILFGVVALRRGREPLGGSLLGAGVLVKLLPVFLFPFLAIRAHTPKLRFVLAFAAVLLLGIGIPYSIWGSLSLRPFLFGGSVGAVATVFSSLNTLFPAFDFGRFSTPLVLAALFAIFARNWRRKEADPLWIALEVLFAVFTFYRLGLSQYYVTGLFLLAYARISEREAFRGRLGRAALIYVLYANLYVVIYLLTDLAFPDAYASFDLAHGFVYFAINLYLWSALLGRAGKVAA